MGEKIRPIFIYLAFIAIVLGAVGLVIMGGDLTGRAIRGETYSLNEVSLHNSEQDCWIAADNRVYDITLFLQIYPEDLSGRCGKEISSKLFSDDVTKSLEQYQIGTLK